MSIVLASGSPRRRELLSMIGIKDFLIITDDSAERILPGLSPEETVCEIALGKAKNVARLCGSDSFFDNNEAKSVDDRIIIADDTLVYLDDKAFGKPASEEEAFRMLRELSARRHTVYTGVAILSARQQAVCAEMTEVFFREISDAEILAYIETGEPMDKAGAYGAQGRGAVFVERIEGDFFNVMGLPLCRLSIMLRDFGVVV